MGNCTQRPSIDIRPSFVEPEPITKPLELRSSLESSSSDSGKPPLDAARAISQKIDRQLLADQRKQEKTMKLLFLGPAESGKSTLLKQLKIIHLNGYTRAELLNQRTFVYQNVVESMLQLLNGARKLELELPSECADYVRTVTAVAHVTLITFDEHIFTAIKGLWQADVIQDVYERRSDFHLLDCAKYFLDELDRLYCEDYCPTVDDVLNARVVTHGVHELRYPYGDHEFRIVDVGGQRSERRKWISVFDNVNAVFFVAAMSEYDQVMMEDDETNRLVDAIRLFNDIGNNPHFTNAHMILFLNKKDLFAEKIHRVRLTYCFPSYRFKNDYKNASAYIARKFEKQIQSVDKNIYTHFTCAKDTDQMEFLTNSVTDMIIAAAIKRAGTN